MPMKHKQDTVSLKHKYGTVSQNTNIIQCFHAYETQTRYSVSETQSTVSMKHKQDTVSLKPVSYTHLRAHETG